jgi:hypothetical protein
MKKLFYRFSSRRSLAKLFSLLACVALGSVFTQWAVAQEYEFGWEPFPPSSWEGGWDASLRCEAVDGTTTLTRMPPSKDSVVQDGTVRCTFTDPANTGCGSNCNAQGFFEATANCSLHIQINNLTEGCVNNSTSPPSSTLTVTGTCPVATVPNGQGTINCTGASFCSYAGNDPDGNTSGQCVWNLGWGALKGQKVVPLTQTQCQNAFGAAREVFSFSQTLEGLNCPLSSQTQVVDLKPTLQNFCHSDTWDPSQAAFCDFPRGGVKNTATGTVENFLTADTEYSPNTINADCRPGKDQGDITLLVHGNNSDPGTNPIAVQAINQNSITVNISDIPNFPVFKADRCDFPNPDTLRCRVPSCLNGRSIIENTIVPGTKTATLTMDALMNDGTTHVVGDVEIRGAN